MHRGGTEKATDGEPGVNRIDMELVSDLGIPKVLCIDFRASVTGLWQVVTTQLPQRRSIRYEHQSLIQVYVTIQY